jgi:hypothetical protein
MVDLRYILGRQDALAEVAVRIKTGGAESALAYCQEQLEMTRQAESELLDEMAKDMEAIK